LWAAAYGLRAVVQGALYLANRPGWLAVARLITGWPLFVATLPPTAALLRRAHAEPVEAPGGAPSPDDLEVLPCDTPARD
jgi:hypothetical protein